MIKSVKDNRALDALDSIEISPLIPKAPKERDMWAKQHNALSGLEICCVLPAPPAVAWGYSHHAVSRHRSTWHG